MGVLVRQAAVAGTWYPGTARAVAAEVDGYLQAAGEPGLPGRLVALVSPHAGLRYSGPVAAHGYALLRGRAGLTAVLVGPSHHAAFDGIAACASEAWQTPLGRVDVDRELTAALQAAAPSLVGLDAAAHRDEHSLEMQLPFLQRLVPALRIVPLLMGGQSSRETHALGDALAQALAGRREILLVASSDLSHYQPAPIANRRDAVVAEQVGRFDHVALGARLEDEDNVACGGGPIVAVMRAAQALGADRATVLKYGDSGDVEGRDKSRVVGYLSAALWASGA